MAVPISEVVLTKFGWMTSGEIQTVILSLLRWILIDHLWIFFSLFL